MRGKRAGVKKREEKRGVGKVSGGYARLIRERMVSEGFAREAIFTT